jgi:glycosyltransferase involved in cell wall biosynthesis
VTFSYPPRPQDRLLAAAARAERLGRGLLRRLGSGELLALARRHLAAGPPPGGGDEAAPIPAGAPLLYLPAVAWDYRFQRPQHLARALAAAGHPVLYLEGFLRTRLQPARQLLAAAPGVSRLRLRIPGRPDPYRAVLSDAAAARLAEVVVAGLPARPLCVLVQLPFWAALGRALAGALGVPLVYDRIDLHAGFPGVPPEVAAAERRLAADADLVTATAGALADDLAGQVRRLAVIRNAVDLPAFSSAAPSPRPPGAPPTIAYVGALGPWFDAPAVAAAAARHPDWRIRLAGEVEDPAVAALGARPNIELLGEIPFRAVPPFLAAADVALVPFRDLPLTRAVDPVKLYEALALGLPVVARRLPETARWAEPLVFLYDTPESFIAQIERALATRTPEVAEESRRAAAGESWEARARQLLAAVAGLPSM